jgi:hypothetical protein
LIKPQKNPSKPPNPPTSPNFPYLQKPKQLRTSHSSHSIIPHLDLNDAFIALQHFDQLTYALVAHMVVGEDQFVEVGVVAQEGEESGEALKAKVFVEEGENSVFALFFETQQEFYRLFS